MNGSATTTSSSGSKFKEGSIGSKFGFNITQGNAFKRSKQPPTSPAAESFEQTSAQSAPVLNSAKLPVKPVLRRTNHKNLAPSTSSSTTAVASSRTTPSPSSSLTTSFFVDHSYRKRHPSLSVPFHTRVRWNKRRLMIRMGILDWRIRTPVRMWGYLPQGDGRERIRWRVSNRV
ncbi:hypothetical protein BC829DRAFT_77677 [Chytridium lagenaria]|nr:hypothetical protein BC829DRAFT_77677 [Chytridium lagenaria]